MKRKIMVWGIIVAVILTIASCWYIFDQHRQSNLACDNYYNLVYGEWNKLQSALTETDSSIQTGSCDFHDINNSVNGLKSNVDKMVSTFSEYPLPTNPEIQKFNKLFVAGLGKTSDSLKSISENCTSWSESKISDMKQKTKETRDALSECVTNWHGEKTLQTENDLFIQLPSIFNKMRKARQVAKSSSNDSVTSSSTISVPVFTDPVRAAYFSRLRSLMIQYKGLRDQLGGGITDRIHKVGFQPGDSNVLTSAYNSRDAIVKEIEAMPLPSGCFGLYQVAHDAVVNGRDAVQYLQYGNWDRFHEMSNNGIAKSAYRTFGLGE